MGYSYEEQQRADYIYTQEAKEILTVRCWCERIELKVPASEILKGRTASCGLFECHP